jgi:hypothetical protein
MRTLLRTTTGLLLALASVATAPILGAQDDLTRRDRQGPVTVAVTLLPPAGEASPIRIKVVLDTHSTPLDGIALQQAVVLQAPDGSEVAPAAIEEEKGGGHHREAVLVFPAMARTNPLRIVVRNVGGVPERSFTWDVAR